MFPNPNEPTTLTLTLDQTARYLGVGARALNTLLDSGALHFVRVGRQRLVPRQSLVNFLTDPACTDRSAYPDRQGLMSVQRSMFD